jgi:hypothetical protein
MAGIKPASSPWKGDARSLGHIGERAVTLIRITGEKDSRGIRGGEARTLLARFKASRSTPRAPLLATPPAGFEPAISSLTTRRGLQLPYGGKRPRDGEATGFGEISQIRAPRESNSVERTRSAYGLKVRPIPVLAGAPGLIKHL